MNFGTAKGLAYRHDWDATMRREMINTQRLQEQKQLDEAKAKYYAEKFKLSTPTNEFDRSKYEDHVLSVNDQITDFITANPNWESDIGLQMKFNQLTDQYLNNDILIRDQRVKQQVDGMEAWARENNISENDAELVRMREEYHNYVRFGNIKGEGFQGEVEEFKFIKPNDIDMTTIGQKAATFLNESATTEMQSKGGTYGTRTYVDPIRIRQAAQAIYDDNTSGVTRMWNKVTDDDKEKLYKGDIINFVEGYIQPYIGGGYKPQGQWASSGSGSGDSNAANINSWYYKDIYNKKNIYSDKVKLFVPHTQNSSGKNTFTGQHFKVSVNDPVKEGEQKWLSYMTYGKPIEIVQFDNTAKRGILGKMYAKGRVRLYEEDLQMPVSANSNKTWKELIEDESSGVNYKKFDPNNEKSSSELEGINIYFNDDKKEEKPYWDVMVDFETIENETTAGMYDDSHKSTPSYEGENELLYYPGYYASGQQKYPGFAGSYGSMSGLGKQKEKEEAKDEFGW